MSGIYECNLTREQGAVLEQLRSKISKVAGVTLQGNRLTVRWHDEGVLVSAHMIIESVRTQSEAEEASRQRDEMQKLFKKYPDLNGELFYVEHGEHSQ